MAKKKFYVVVKGRQPGLFHTWDEAKEQVNGFPDAIFKGFSTMEGAEEYAVSHQMALNVPSTKPKNGPKRANAAIKTIQPLKKRRSASTYPKMNKRSQVDFNLFKQQIYLSNICVILQERFRKKENDKRMNNPAVSAAGYQFPD